MEYAGTTIFERAGVRSVDWSIYAWARTTQRLHTRFVYGRLLWVNNLSISAAFCGCEAVGYIQVFFAAGRRSAQESESDRADDVYVLRAGWGHFDYFNAFDKLGQVKLEKRPLSGALWISRILNLSSEYHC